MWDLRPTRSAETDRPGWLTEPMRPGSVEITDLLWSVDCAGQLRPVLQADVLNRLTGTGQRRAARIVARMPTVGGRLDPDHVNALGVRVHCELQRLGEELQFPRRVAALLTPMVASLRQTGRETIRVVDIGCGLGYVLRSLAASGALGADIELVGVDLNPVLIAEASRLAGLERLNCRFVVGDASTPGRAIEDGAQTIVVSSGVLHHLPVPGSAPDW